MTTEYVNTLKATGGDYSSLTTWEADIDGFDYTVATTKVFSHSGITGTIGVGATVTGQTSLATGTVIAVVTSTQILLGSITGTFISGEVVQVSAGNSVTISNAGDDASPGVEVEAGTHNPGGTFTIFGATTSTTNRLFVRPITGAEHGMIPGAGVVFSRNAGASILFTVKCVTTISDIELINTGTSSTSRTIQALTIDGTILDSVIAKSIGGDAFFKMQKDTLLSNCLAYSSVTGFSQNNFQSPRFYNCGSANSTTGFQSASSGGILMDVRNCWSFGATTSYSGARFDTVNSTNNAADDSAINTPPGVSPFTTDITSSDFVDSANDDYHLASGSVLISAGSDLSSVFTTDGDGDTRTNWDIGFDEFIAAGGGVGTDTGTGTINVGSITLSGTGNKKLIGTSSINTGITALSGTGTKQVSNTAGNITLSPISVSGNGSTVTQGTVLGSGDITVGAATLSGNGILSKVGSGNINTSNASVSGAGIRTLKGTGAITAFQSVKITTPSTNSGGNLTFLSSVAKPTIVLNTAVIPSIIH